MFLNQTSVTLKTATLDNTATGDYFLDPYVLSSEVDTSPVKPLPNNLIVHVFVAASHSGSMLVTCGTAEVNLNGQLSA